MSRFTDSQEIPVTLDDESVPFEERDVIWIKARMDVGTRRAVAKALATTTMGAGGVMRAELDLTGSNWVLLENNITRWQGPGFDNEPFSVKALNRLDPDDPLLDKVLAEINKRNSAQEPVSIPNSANGGGKSSQAPSPKKTRGNMTSISS